jgi:acyl-CoA dehydrogenase
MDFELTERCKQYAERVQAFMDEHVYPAEPVYEQEMAASDDPHHHPAVLERLKDEARRQGLWNLFHPHAHTDPPSPGLTNVEYAPLAEIMGRSLHLAPEAMNCSAPDTGNMEVLQLFGTEEHKEKFLRPLLDGEIRSAFAMTEPRVASSDARNIEMSITRDGDEYVLNGRKWWTSNALHKNCRVLIVMGKTNPEGPPHRQQSMLVVPIDTAGVTVMRGLPVFGYQDREGLTPRRRGRRLRHQPGAARPRPDPPLHAVHRDGRARAPADVRAGPASRHVRPAAGGALQHRRLDRRGPRRP